jgi:hypothetical protein
MRPGNAGNHASPHGGDCGATAVLGESGGISQRWQRNGSWRNDSSEIVGTRGGGLARLYEIITNLG